MAPAFIRTAFRTFRKNKWVSLINVLGLAIGMSAALVIFLIARYDLNFDQFESRGDRIFRVVTNFTSDAGSGNNPGVCAPLPSAVSGNVSGLELAVPLFGLNAPDVIIEKHTFREQPGIAFTTPDYFKLLNFQWLAGVPSSLAEPYQTILTSDQARQYFPGLAFEEMIGKTIVYDSIRTTVSGIIAPLKENTGFTYRALIAYSTILTDAGLQKAVRMRNWGGTWPTSQFFVRLAPGKDPAAVTSQLNAILISHGGGGNNAHRTQSFALQPLSDIHVNPLYGGIAVYNDVVSKSVLSGLTAIAIFLLLLACINFINLSTAQGGQRAKEVGIRKTIGSSRAQLIRQFLGETILLALIALVLSLLLAPNLLKLFSGFIPAGVRLDPEQPALWCFAVVLVLVVGLAAGIYPALVLSGYKPVLVLKNQLQSGGRGRNSLLRKSLTVSQFVIAQFFIIATALVSKQIWYATHKDLGFKKDAIVTLDTYPKTSTGSKNRLLLGQLNAIPGVALASLGFDAPSSDHTNSTEASYSDGKKEIHMDDLDMKFGDSNFVHVYQIPLLAGRNIMPADMGKAFLVNEAFTRRIGCHRPSEAVGKVVGYNGNQRMTIVGVVADFNEGSLHDAIAPMALMTGPDSGPDGNFNSMFHIALASTSSGWPETFSRIRQVFHTVYPDDPANLVFVDEGIARMYEKEENTATLLRWATGLSIFISCLGLLGLAIFTTAQRRKEIGVRKVLGASAAGIVALLSKEIVILTLLALLIATPAAIYAINRWLTDFADRTTLSWWVFGTCGASIMFVALLVSAFQTVRAALANPVNSLRSE